MTRIHAERLLRTEGPPDEANVAEHLIEAAARQHDHRQAEPLHRCEELMHRLPGRRDEHEVRVLRHRQKSAGPSRGGLAPSS